ncbi:MAG TPA: ribonuclease HII, partial [Candidatus Hydrogenedentes bacterium]|nr:ribonuclease HII [Candidatus Hydrogenedentota bacterium]
MARISMKTRNESAYSRPASEVQETQRLEAMLVFERRLAAQGFRCVAGVDEAGRGPLAGPIVAAAVVLACPLPGLDDSKRLSAARREELYAALYAGGHGIGVAAASAAEINREGIQAANYRVMQEAVARLPVRPDF